MSAAEIIEMIKKLPPEEEREVRDYLSAPAGVLAEEKVEYISRKTIEETSDRIFAEHPTLFRKLAQ